MEYLLLGVFLAVEGANRLGFRFDGDETVKGVLLFLAGLFMVFFHF